MQQEMYDDMAIEQNAKQYFGVRFDIDHVVLRNAPVGRMVTASVFLTTKKQLYVYIDGQARLTLADVKKIITRMGLVAELFLPPKGHPRYFDEIGREKFTEIFPGRTNPTADDLMYYRTLAPYKPALVQILEVKDGEIHQFDADATGGWRLATKFTYRRIKTS